MRIKRFLRAKIDYFAKKDSFCQFFAIYLCFLCLISRNVAFLSCFIINLLLIESNFKFEQEILQKNIVEIRLFYKM